MSISDDKGKEIFDGSRNKKKDDTNHHIAVGIVEEVCAGEKKAMFPPGRKMHSVPDMPERQASFLFYGNTPNTWYNGDEYYW